MSLGFAKENNTTGASGPTGPVGATGPTAATGPTGPQGPITHGKLDAYLNAPLLT